MADDDGRFARSLGRRVRAAREAAQMTQGGVELAGGLRPPMVARLERGEIADLAVTDLVKVAAAVGVEPATLVPPAGGDPR